MKLKHFLEDIDSLIRAGLLNEYSEVNITEIRAHCLNLFFNNPEYESEIEDLKSDIRNNEKEIKELEEKLKEEEEVCKRLEREAEKYFEELDKFKINEGESAKDLLKLVEDKERQVNQYKELVNSFRQHSSKIEEENKRLRARKNKVEVKRSLTTGRLGVSFEGVEYELTEIRK